VFDGSIFLLSNSLHDTNETNKENPQSIDDWQLKSVSTSTSGLSDFIVSTRFRVINDTIKRFEQTFNKQNSISQTSLNFLSSSPSAYFSYNLPINGVTETTAIATYTSNLKSLTAQQKLVNLKTRASNHSAFTNGFHKSETTTNSNQNTNNNNIKSLNGSATADQGQKSISSCIDIDGLTLVNDNYFKRIIERDIEYKNEITQLKSQVQKCKLFLNSLSSNVLWNEINNDFSIELV
jgi:hypothetical protein